eukprot:925366_1
MTVEKENWCWNNEDKDDYITLSNDNLTVTHKYHAGINHLIRGNEGYSDGVHSFKIRVDTYDGDGNRRYLIGFATLDAPRQTNWNLSERPNFWGFRDDMYMGLSNVKGTTKKLQSMSVKTGDIVTVTLDTVNR